MIYARNISQDRVVPDRFRVEKVVLRVGYVQRARVQGVAQLGAEHHGLRAHLGTVGASVVAHHHVMAQLGTENWAL